MFQISSCIFLASALKSVISLRLVPFSRKPAILVLIISCSGLLGYLCFWSSLVGRTRKMYVCGRAHTHTHTLEIMSLTEIMNSCRFLHSQSSSPTLGLFLDLARPISSHSEHHGSQPTLLPLTHLLSPTVYLKYLQNCFTHTATENSRVV